MKIKIHHLLIFFTIALTIYAGVLSYKSTLSRSLRDLEKANICFFSIDQTASVNKLQAIYLVQLLPKDRSVKVMSIAKNINFTAVDGQNERLADTFNKKYRETKNLRTASESLRNGVQLFFGNSIDTRYYCSGTPETFDSLLKILKVPENNPYETLSSDPSEIYKYSELSVRANRVTESVRSTLFLFRSIKAVSFIRSKFISNLSLWDWVVLSIELKNLKTLSPQVASIGTADTTSISDTQKGSAKDTYINFIASNSPETRKIEEPLRVEVWNASGRKDLAKNVTWLLRRNGYDVLDFGTFSSNEVITIIKDFSDSQQESQAIKKLLGCGEIVSTYKPNRFVDIYIVLGQDCEIQQPL